MVTGFRKKPGITDIGGRMVIPVGDMYSQTMYTVKRISDDDYKEEKNDRFKFVPLIGKEGWENE